MYITAEHVLGTVKPKVFWGENAPGFAGKIGDTVRNGLRKIGKDNGYTMTVYRTKTLLHGGPQIRERSFYFFWRDERVPLLNYYSKPYTKIEDVIRGAKSDLQSDPINRMTSTISLFLNIFMAALAMLSSVRLLSRRKFVTQTSFHI